MPSAAVQKRSQVSCRRTCATSATQPCMSPLPHPCRCMPQHCSADTCSAPALLPCSSLAARCLSLVGQQHALPRPPELPLPTAGHVGTAPLWRAGATSHQTQTAQPLHACLPPAAAAGRPLPSRFARLGVPCNKQMVSAPCPSPAGSLPCPRLPSLALQCTLQRGAEVRTANKIQGAE